MACLDSMNFFTVKMEALFCESKHWAVNDLFGRGSVTEVVNAISNIFYLAIGMAGFYFSMSADSGIKLMYSLLFVTGIGSTLFHATGWRGLRMLDELPMLILINCFIIIYHEQLCRGGKMRHCTRRLLDVSSYILAGCLLVFCLAQMCVSNPVVDFYMLFGFETGYIFALTLIIKLAAYWREKKPKQVKDERFLKSLALRRGSDNRLREVIYYMRKLNLAQPVYRPTRHTDTQTDTHTDTERDSDIHAHTTLNILNDTNIGRGSGSSAPLLSSASSSACPSPSMPPLSSVRFERSQLSQQLKQQSLFFLKRVWIIFAIGFAIWNCDRSAFCNKYTVFLLLHVWWHLTSALAAHFAICFFSLNRAVAFYQLPKIEYWLGLPFVSWHEDQLLIEALVSHINTVDSHKAATGDSTFSKDLIIASQLGLIPTDKDRDRDTQRDTQRASLTQTQTGTPQADRDKTRTRTRTESESKRYTFELHPEAVALSGAHATSSNSTATPSPTSATRLVDINVNQQSTLKSPAKSTTSAGTPTSVTASQPQPPPSARSQPQPPPSARSRAASALQSTAEKSPAGSGSPRTRAASAAQPDEGSRHRSDSKASPSRHSRQSLDVLAERASRGAR